MLRKTTILFLGLFILACNRSEKNTEDKKGLSPALFTLLTEEETGISFVNKVKNRKDFNIFKYRNFYNGGGVAIGDIDNDSLPDVYLTSNMGENKLYRNLGDLRFEDITEKAGVQGTRAWSTGVVMVDINADGLLDIYVCNAGSVKGDDQENELFINNGDGTFTEKAREYNLADSGFTTHAAFFDYDGDGDLDVYILNNSFIPVNSLGYSNKRDLRALDWSVPDMFKGGGDKLMRNDNGVFTDVSEEAGIYGSLIGFGLGVTVGDINGDLSPDIYVSNDFYERDYLYINNGNGTFTEDIKNWASHLSFSSMGADMADIDNNGLSDIFVTDMLPEGDERLKTTTSFERYDLYNLMVNRDFYHQYMQNTLQLNTGHHRFSEIAHFSGVSRTDWSWGALIFDMDNDGHKDIYVCNGINHDLTDQDFIDFFANDFIRDMVSTGKKEVIDTLINRMPSTPVPNYAFRNNNDLTFSDSTTDWGFDIPSFSNGAAYADLDNDGDPDLIVNNVNQELFVFKNNTDTFTENAYLKIKLEGEKPNTFGIGSIVEVYSNHEIIRQELIPSRGFQSSIDYVMTVGLGTKRIDSLRVIWPDRKTQLLTEVFPNRLLVLKQQAATDTFIPKKQGNTKTLFTEVPVEMEPHREPAYIDFDYEGLISKMLSREGPAVAVADIDGDGNEDIFTGSAKGQPGNIYLQKSNNRFVKTTQAALEDDARFEDTAATFFDADGDGYPDLLVGSGGNETTGPKSYMNRLYINDGNGNFEKSAGEVPSTSHNTSVIVSCDFDSDGDTDIFVGSRSVPGIYGIAPDHLLLENDGNGNFKDVTESRAFDLKELGMITDARWADMDGDGIKDLVIVGDWMAPTVLKNDGKRLQRIATSLDELTGWWNTLEVADLNNDGKEDLVLGNQGENTSYKTSAEAPMKMFVNDFDNNSTIEQVVTRTVNGRDVPVALKKEITAQMSSLKKQNLKFSDYATKSIDELFPADVLKNSIQRNAVTAKSMVAINQGDGGFSVTELPREVQFSCICSITATDINGNGYPDLIMGGNNYHFKPQFSRLDANYGAVLFNDGQGGQGNFNWLDYTASGFFVTGEVRYIRPVADSNGETCYFVARNNDTPLLFKKE
ncbi:VCBS repeat-containing protein [Sinomicrobium weinanense]|uniref:VCBS repeat-containing protein n=1 Tax=Sinomicrobium weinanense TaxID=2842200 RepID=A0A926JPY6_9FLAO|nr:VCBS repeat-containing protein [Sinomicrobium weinanense]MBC9795179.1 VCBS repeat-containing protein [Sinomicrobium weinanense]MBU3121956.1 VCBS repeat-containing protein [Sinomicrobium weinanense]